MHSALQLAAHMRAQKLCAFWTCIFAMQMMRLAVAEGTGGIVREVNNGIASVDFAGPAPSVGDKVQFFFEMEGLNEEISVAEGTVTAVEEGGHLKVKIENATGDVAKDHLARFTPGTGSGKSTTAAVTPPPTTELPPVVPKLPPPAIAQTEVTPPVTTLPPSVPFPSATPKGKPAAPLSNSDETIAAPYVNKGIAQYNAGNIEGAIASYTEGIRAAPSVAVLYLNRANAYLYKPNFQAALMDANKAMELKVPQMDDAYNIRGTAKAGLGDFDAALADCNRALKINPSNALAYNNRSNNKLRRRDYSGALADCNKSMSLDANSALPYYNRGFAYYNLGNASAAVSDWKKAVALQASFGAELNPKIAQLQAAGVSAQQSTATTTTRAQPPEAQWTDLTNASRKIVGSWKGGRHVTQYRADGSFYTDPHLVPNPPRGQWQIQGDRLIQFFPPANLTTTHQILSITSNELVLRNAKGETFRFKRGTE